MYVERAETEETEFKLQVHNTGNIYPQGSELLHD